MLNVNPLAGARGQHSSNVRFARTDVWVRDINQVIDDAIARAQPTDGRVTLIGYSLGAFNVGRTLSAAPAVPKVDRVAFLSPFFGGPAEETPPPEGFATFPLTVSRIGTVGFLMPPGRDTVCTGHIVDGVREQRAAQILDQDPLAAGWGGNVAGQPSGLIRSPTFSSYGWNTDVAGRLTTPTLVMQGVDDIVLPGGVQNARSLYDALPASMTNKVLVEAGCASHDMVVEGCSGVRCMPESGAPYGGIPGRPWAGPHATLTAALIEWIEAGTFNGAGGGRFSVDDSGVVNG